MEKWEPYEKTRESLWEMLEDSSRHSGTPEEKQTLLMDYEMSLILASYLMGMHESRVTDCHIKNPEKILEILDDFSPLAEEKQIRQTAINNKKQALTQHESLFFIAWQTMVSLELVFFPQIFYKALQLLVGIRREVFI